MLFSKLLESAGLPMREFRGDAEVTEIVVDSRRCRGGSCFVAVRGVKVDAHKFIPAALSAGCSAVVCEDPSGVPEGVAVAVVDNSRVAEARLAQAILGWPSRKLTCVGVTGTNGKSTTTYLIRDILEAANLCPGLLGTLFYETGGRTVEANQTTPDALTLAAMTEEMVAAGMTHLVMEASSHALHQDRCAGLEFQVGVFTNLTGDHLDYHKTMENYLLAKQRLFEGMKSGAAAVLNLDDSASQSLAEAARASGARVIFYGLNPRADVYGRVTQADTTGTTFDLVTADKTVTIRTPLIGKHNISNCLAAAGACSALGIDLEKIASVLAGVKVVPGRLERVPVEAPFSAFVDYAHTDDAMKNVLTALRPLTKGKLTIVFGCGGDRDTSKRPRMAKVAEQLADDVYVTSDNPRTEQPGAIIEQVLAGFTPAGRKRICVQADRRKAIELALATAQAGDIVLIAGKGHEKYQDVAGVKHYFDDVEVARNTMLAAGGRA